ncbi:S1C family serine protease [Candidatus Laterigemmans baculatus]|uniref:S1C family serine protease n=1 Tax=Candidatus Laterigemmans baculatus TaxID=2770505 RepID=UPI0013DCD476|nr:trypsin-like peptidase domain-containing protein [Candidatus Laterigemmans baculatus]
MTPVPARLRLALLGGLLLTAFAARAEPVLGQSQPPSLVTLEPAAGAEAGDPRLSDDQRAAEDELYEALATEVASLERISNVVRQVARLVRPRVVHVEASKVERSQGRSEAFDEAGSGVLITHGQSTWVLTNRHVVAGAEPSEISLRLGDGRVLVPSQVLADPSTDVAILSVPDPQLGATRIGDSDTVTVGDFVLAVGSPFGLSHSVTFGIISATGRRDLTLGEERIELQDFFQTDAAINPGNSGGPLLNLRGEVIALNTAIASSSGGSEGIGFAIPINMVMQVVDQLVEYGHVRRAYLGVTLDPDFEPGDALQLGLPRSGGALVKAVNAHSPAAEAGIAKGDVITQFDGVRIDNDDHLVTRVGLTAVGKAVEVILYRGGSLYQTTVTVIPYPG